MEVTSAEDEELLLILCDESKRSRLEEYLTSPDFGCHAVAPSEFLPAVTTRSGTAATEDVKEGDDKMKKKQKRKRALLDSVCLLCLRLPTSTSPSSSSASSPSSLREPSPAFGAFLQARLFHHPFLYRYAKSFYFATDASLDLRFLEAVARDAVRTGKVLRLCVFPRSLTAAVVGGLPPEVQLHPKQFTHVLSVVREQGRYLYSLAPHDLFWGPESGVHSVHMDKVSRAYHKINEVFLRDPCLARADTSHWTAIDVGAAPGGWTQYLSPRVQRVISVDPGELRIEIPPNVVHLKKKVEDCMEQLQREAPVDLVACDMNMCEALQAIDVMLPLAPLLRPGGFVVMTWKLPKRVDEALEAKTEELRANFAERFVGFEIVSVMWLLANMYERTVVARKLDNAQ